MQESRRNFNRSVLAITIMAAMGMSLPVKAVSFNWGEVDGTFDSTFSAGASWRAQERDWDNQIGKVNHPRFDWTGYSAFTGNIIYTPAQIWSQPGSYSSNGDLSDLLYSQGDTTSEMVKGLHELSLNYENYGVFVRGMYFYDRVLVESDFEFTDPLTDKSYDACADSKASEVQCKDVRLLDAFVYANFDLNQGENPLAIRVGQQVISWGESTLIAHGIGVINPVDLNILNAPGAELKEAYRPQGMLWASLGITHELSVEAFYQYDWQEVWVPTSGSFFSTNDFAGFGGYHQNAQLGFNANPDMNIDFLLSEYNDFLALMASNSLTPEQLEQYALAYPTKATLVKDSQSASNDGQWGVKFGYYAPDLGETEFGLYYMNYHSRRPLISGTTANFTAEAVARDLLYLGGLAENGTTMDRSELLNLETFSKAQIVYPEDIQLIGFSFNTLVGDTSVAGEIAHRLDEPLQIDDVELLFAAMPQQLANADDDLVDDYSHLDGVSQMEVVEPGETADGYIRTDTTQAQVTFTHLFGPSLGNDGVTALAEIGAIWIHDMPGFNELRLNGPGTANSGGNLAKPGIIQALHNGPETNPFPTDFAWGYRFVLKTDYNNIFAGVNMSPRFIFSHDVEGITPDPLYLFTEDKKSIAVGLGFDYQSSWAADVSYNTYFDGVGTTNTLEDRDYISFNIKYSI
ncbi:DUF1302 domain-containing protein [Shewanella surugensis]|uniref:DUF1302 domain-containing protein n=1 Tax=Shewanella surugensis TaxID=212020 RepID=A0ABT0LB24_9GAMM|nr:DUF1302 domain-containing protein [Shewanella surugensis]MCL1124873.1 DUF1302 domain-containing protein [Shewanella surugensis]